MRKLIPIAIPVLLLRIALALAAVCGAGTAQAAPPPTGTLTIVVPNIRTGQGHLHVAICTQALFLEDDCKFKAITPAIHGETVATVSNLPAGTYAVQAYLDENGNDKLDRNFLGIPREGVGFSNDPVYTFSPPDFADCSFSFDGISKTIRFSLRYY